MANRVPPRIWRLIDLWAESEDRAGSLFAARCSSVFELYSLGLAAGKPMPAWSSWARIFVGPWPYLDADIGYLDRPSGRDGDPEAIHARVPAGFLDSPESSWPAMYLDWLHQVLTDLAEIRGYDLSILEGARKYCLDRGIRLQLEAPPRSSRDRRHRAHLTFEIDAHGDRLVDLVIRDRAGTVVGASTTRTGAFGPTVRDFRKLGRDLWWSSPTSAETMETFYRIVTDVGRTRHGSLWASQPVRVPGWRPDLPTTPVWRQ